MMDNESHVHDVTRPNMDTTFLLEDDSATGIAPITKPTNCPCNYKELIQAMESRVLSELRQMCNKRLKDFFETAGTFDKQLEALVENKLQDMLLNASSTLNTSVLEHNAKPDAKEQQAIQENLNIPVAQNPDTLRNLVNDYQTEIDTLKRKREELNDQHTARLNLYEEQRRKLLEIADRGFAHDVASQELNKENAALKIRLMALEQQNIAAHAQLDKMEQYSRREILEFLNIPQRYEYDPKGGKDNPYDVIM